MSTITKSIGEDFSLGLIVTKIDGTTAEDLSSANWQIYYGLFTSKYSGAWADALVSKTVAGGGIVKTTPASGACRIDIADTDTADLSPGTYYQFIKTISPGGLEADVIKGQAIKLAYSPMSTIVAA